MKGSARILASLVAGVLLVAAPSRAVLIASGDGMGNVTPPADDPGWANVGKRDVGFSVVYLGSGWVLTANHVGAGDAVFSGKRYAAVPGSVLRLLNPDLSPTDLLLFRVTPWPPLPTLQIASQAPTTGATATLIGNGADRGPATSWKGIPGYVWGSTNTIRWGTAPVSESGVIVGLGDSKTRTFSTAFVTGATPSPGQAAVGDSGGAGFLKVDGAWVLAGVMVAIEPYSGQPASTSLFGNVTFAADLSYYRDQLVPLIAPMHCGLGFELGFVLPPLLWLRSRRKRTAISQSA